MPLSDVAGSAGAVDPEQIVAGKAAKAGVVLFVTFTVTVTGIAQIPAFGVNVYCPVVVLLTIAGFQVPAIPSSEVAGRVGAVVPEHIVAGKAAKAGVTGVDMVTLSVAIVPHCPASGVKVYTIVPIVVVEIVAGFQVPVIFSIEESGNAGAVEF
jgi:hypothetical protein